MNKLERISLEDVYTDNFKKEKENIKDSKSLLK